MTCFIEEKIRFKQVSLFLVGKYFSIYPHLYINMQIILHPRGFINTRISSFSRLDKLGSLQY